MPTENSAGALIRKKLEELGLSQRAAAARIGISQAHLSDMLNGRRGVSVAMAVRLEEALKLKASDLLAAQTDSDLRAVRQARKVRGRRAAATQG